MEDYSNHMDLGFDDDYEDNDFMPEPDEYRFKFPDGSVIILRDQEYETELPNRAVKLLWMAEEVAGLIDLNIWSNDQIIKYIESYEKR